MGVLGCLFSVFFRILLNPEEYPSAAINARRTNTFGFMFLPLCFTSFGAQPNRHSKSASDGFTPTVQKDGASTV